MKIAVFYSFHKHLLSLSFLLLLFMISSVLSCSRNDAVKDYFASHGMNYPVDVVGVSLFGLDYSGIESDELTAPGSREFIEEGIMFIKLDLQKKNPEVIVSGAAAVRADKVVFYRAESGEVGLMVRVTAYGQEEPSENIRARIEWIGKDEGFWKFEDYAYYVRNELYMWEFGGWLFHQE
jgi:hypothetical protein